MVNMQHTGFGASVPVARIEDLVITESADEVLVYDKQRHEIHHLNKASAVVWRLCDGKRSVAELARHADVDVEITQVAVNKLAEANLLEGPLSSKMRISSPSRRAFLRKAVIAGAAVPVIASISAPNAAAGGSCQNNTCPPGTKKCCPRGTLAVCVVASGLADACIRAGIGPI